MHVSIPASHLEPCDEHRHPCLVDKEYCRHEHNYCGQHYSSHADGLQEMSGKVNEGT